MKSLFLIFLFFTIHKATAGDLIQSSRYTDVNISATKAQKDPLSVIINFEFPRNIEKVGDALYLITAPSGYRFSLDENDIAYILFEMPLPEVHKQLGPITLRDAISVLSGNGFQPVFDNATRLISFESLSESISSVNVEDFKVSWLSSRQLPTKGSIVSVDLNEPDYATFDSDSISESISFAEYEVVLGDSISKIAGKLGLEFTSVLIEEIVTMNSHAFLDQNPDLLLEGQTIKVPYL